MVLLLNIYSGLLQNKSALELVSGKSAVLEQKIPLLVPASLGVSVVPLLVPFSPGVSGGGGGGSGVPGGGGGGGGVHMLTHPTKVPIAPLLRMLAARCSAAVCCARLSTGSHMPHKTGQVVL